MKHSLQDIINQVHHQPVRTAQRLLRIFGDDTEQIVWLHFPAVKERDDMLREIRAQRERWATRCWNKGYVRSY